MEKKVTLGPLEMAPFLRLGGNKNKQHRKEKG